MRTITKDVEVESGVSELEWTLNVHRNMNLGFIPPHLMRERER